MKTIVLDANIAVKWTLAEDKTSDALVLRDEFIQGICQLIAPDIFPIEVAHALTRAERRRVIPPGDAISKLADVMAVSPTLHPHLPLLPRAMEIAYRSVRCDLYRPR